jgi:hypothetical protein
VISLTAAILLIALGVLLGAVVTPVVLTILTVRTSSPRTARQTPEDPDMQIPAFDTVIAELQAMPAKIQAAKDAAVTAATAGSAQDITDTVAAVQTAADAIVTAAS